LVLFHPGQSCYILGHEKDTRCRIAVDGVCNSDVRFLDTTIIIVVTITTTTPKRPGPAAAQPPGPVDLLDGVIHFGKSAEQAPAERSPT
jgi:hypothetical protein